MAYAAKHHFSEMRYLDIVDCNAGNHGKAFATNFNPEINIREITQNGRYYIRLVDSDWLAESEPLSDLLKLSDLEVESLRLVESDEIKLELALDRKSVV